MKRQQYVVIGLGRFGSSVAMELVQLGYEVLGIDRNEEVVYTMGDFLTHTVTADATDEEMLRSLGIRNFDCGIVAIGDDIQMSILATILLKEMGLKSVVAKAISTLHGRALEKLGVDRVIYPERDMGVRVAHQLVTPNLVDYIELSKDYRIVELKVPSHLHGHLIGDLNPRARFSCSIVALQKDTGVLIAPTAMDRLDEGDTMVIIGANENIQEFEDVINEED
ncbi:trk system potassium uptake protein TrkA [Paenibacillus shirakamiensis]|uniref:Trk system potassium uptake protein TrkA n=1 Tax=Paenibacillus shirakamiensis TaxID=1265935 RepID=A0ABS4JK69_9BACL|nr:TrkA family potassium uptake protein [Paenibacillus shirakamiensis]MBP2002099.1 trk system potassium uptake protein TrkA [Paenibacillus shirakamiensis]